jgi:hypothetical protein
VAGNFTGGLFMNSFDVRVFTIRRRPGHQTFEVRWRVAGHDKSKSFITQALADSYRAELIHAARQGQPFDPATGQPASWTTSEPVTTWYQHAVAYTDMKWPHLAPHSRASLADAPATITPCLPRPPATGHQPQALRAALYQHAFNPQRRRTRPPEPATARTLDWLERASLPVSQLADPHIIRAALDGLCTRLDGTPAAANTISRKRARIEQALNPDTSRTCTSPLHRHSAASRPPSPPAPLPVMQRHEAPLTMKRAPLIVSMPGHNLLTDGDRFMTTAGSHTYYRQPLARTYRRFGICQAGRPTDGARRADYLFWR